MQVLCRGNSSQDWRVSYANSKLLRHFDYNHLARVIVLWQMQQFMGYCTVFALFYFEFKDNSRVQAPGGLYLEGRFTGRFFALRVWGAYIIFGGAYFRNTTVYEKNETLSPQIKDGKMGRFGLRAASSLISEGWEICSSTLFCPRLRLSLAVTSLKITTLSQTAQSVII